MRAALPVAAAALLLLAGSPAPAAACTKLTEVPLRVVEGFPMIPATVNGTPVTMLFDTGAPGLLLLPQAADALRLPPAPLTRMLGTGGDRIVPQVLATAVAVGGAPVPSGPAPVTDLPGVPRTTPPLAGILGATLAAAYDLDLDLPAGRLALHQRGCTTPPVPGTPLALVPSAEDGPLLPVQVNGQALLAILDTGSRATLLSQRAADRLGLAGAISANTARGVDGAPLTLQHIRVRTLSLGPQTVADAPVSITNLQTRTADLLLGLDLLGPRRIWLSYASGTVVIGQP